MNILKNFTDLLCGVFDNSVQLERFKKEGIEGYPFAKHVNTVLNDKIKNLPSDFKGIFILEESYYTVNDHTNSMPHIFLFTEESDGSVKLTSYETPEGYTKQNLTYENIDTLDFEGLKVSEKFTPAIYKENNGVWEGGSVSNFSPVMQFKLFERFSKDVLEVSEIIEVNGKRTFGYDLPLEYRRI